VAREPGADTARALAEGFVGSLSVTLTVPAGAVAAEPALSLGGLL
jgi:hypothetical protein